MMKMKNLKRIIALICVFSMLMVLAVDVFAASSKKGTTQTVTFTVTTGRRDSTLTINPSSGKVTAIQWKNLIKRTTKKVTKSVYGMYTISVSGLGSKTMTSKKTTFKLKKNSTYKVTITYKGMNNLPTTYWDASWKKLPSWKASVNSGASIR